MTEALRLGVLAWSEEEAAIRGLGQSGN
jgi:hypothetical protein